MKSLPQIQRLIKGESPLSVFNRHDIRSARQAFCEFRKNFDFAYWAATEYYIRDIHDADNIVPLKFNSYQHYIIDIIQKRYTNRQQSRYLITKSFGRCGVTTCVQAYILWLQIFKCNKHSFTCTASDLSIYQPKSNLCRYLKRDIVPTDKSIFIPQANNCAFFNTYRNPDYIRGIDLGYLHLADMSHWQDSDGRLSSRVYAAANSSVLLKYDTLVVLEGNVPRDERIYKRDVSFLRLPVDVRMSFYSPICCNTFFLDYVTLSNIPNVTPFFLDINLNNCLENPPKITIPYNPPSSN